MTPITEFVAELARKEIRLRLEGEKLRINAPEGSLTPSLVAQLKARKADLISFLATHQANEAPPSIIKQNQPATLPLSFSQQRLWFLAQFEDKPGIYNLPARLHLSGSLDIPKFESAWKALIDRHEGLRTIFKQQNGEPYQMIEDSNFNLIHTDLSAIASGQRERTIDSITEEEARFPFDLATGPLLRVRLLLLKPEEHILIVTMHHIISDGWSMGVITRDLSELYTQNDAAVTILPDMSLQYADFALWQRQQLQGARLETLLTYWRERLKNAPPLLELPTDRPRPTQQHYLGEHLRTTVPEALVNSLKALSRQNRGTLFMTMQAAFSVLLHRYTGNDDIVMGTPIANRVNAEWENIVGCFINTLVLRNNLADNPRFNDLLASVREDTLESFQHQALPFELLVEALHPERTLSHTPIFQVMFVLQNTRNEMLHLGDVGIEQLELLNPVSKFDLTLSIRQDEHGLDASWNFNTELFDTPTIKRLANHYQILLQGIVESPNTHIAELPLLSRQERNQLLIEINQTEAIVPRDQCLHDLFAQQAAQTPHTVAVRQGAESITFQNLNAEADRWAERLWEFGVGPDKFVALCIEPSFDLVIALLAVLKAGGAYVPLDPEYPDERLNFLLKDAKPVLLITAKKQKDRCLQIWSEPMLVLDDDPRPEDAIPPSYPSTALPRSAPVTPDHLAYVIYTSGSTGKPKGVLTPHRAVVNYLSWAINTYPFLAGKAVPLLGSLSFDGSVPALFGPLLTGRTLILPESENPVEEVADALTKSTQNFSLVKGTPTHLNLFAHLLGKKLDYNLQLPAVVLGGEALTNESVTRWRKLAPTSRIFNQYGPTEATVACCAHELDSEANDFVPIGRPTANTSIYVLDRHRQPVPIGVPGELYVGGPQLARGYLNRPELTQAAFVSNPFGPGKLFKTGDRVRYRLKEHNALPLLEFLGRNDDQVKVNGFRIEIGEIESVLKELPSVEDAAVALRGTAAGERLIGYIVGDDTTDLREALTVKLPRYLIPAQFIYLPRLPLTSGGKLNRSALPDPDAELTVDNVAAQSDAERSLLSIWQTVLDNSTIGVTDNFFHVGGDSIISIQIVSRARDVGFRLSPKDLFKFQTVRELAAIATSHDFSTIDQGPVSGPVLLTPNQERFFAQNWTNPNHYNVPLLLALQPDTRADWLEECIAALIDHHDALRSRFSKGTDGWIQEIMPPGEAPAFAVFDLASVGNTDEVKARQALIQDQHERIDLSKGPLMRTTLVRGRDQDWLSLIANHLVADGFSCRILLEDLQVAYEQRRAGQPIHLPSKTTSLPTWTQRLRKIGPKKFAAESRHWRTLRAKSTNGLPVDFRKGPNTNAVAASVAISLDVDETDAFLNRAAAPYKTKPNELLLVALLETFSTWTQQPDLTLDLEAHGRETQLLDDKDTSLDLSRSVGWFTTTFPVRLSQPSQSDPATLIKAVKEQLRTLPNQGFGYGLQDGDSDPGVAVHFNYIGQFRPLKPDGLARGLVVDSDQQEQAESPEGIRPYLIDINAIVMDGHLQIFFLYSTNHFNQETIGSISAEFQRNLRRILQHCLTPEAGDYTPSDFPAAALNQAQLDALIVNLSVSPFWNRLTSDPIETIQPLTPTQQGMLFESLAFQGSGIHVEQSIFTWVGQFDRTQFEAAWNDVIARHEILRTGFAWEGLPTPLQFVSRNGKIAITEHDIGRLGPEEQKARIEKHIDSDRCRGFDLRHLPLMRVSVFRLTPEMTRVVWTRHHIISDGWSIGILSRDFQKAAEALAAGLCPTSPPAAPFSRYLEWLQGQDTTATENYWSQELADFTTPTYLALTPDPDLVPQPTQSTTLSLTPPLTEQITQTARDLGLTTATLVQAAWSLLLHQETGSTDPVFGITVSGRPTEVIDVETIVGPFITTLPIRIKLGRHRNKTLAEWLAIIQSNAVEREAHHYASNGQIHQWSGLPMSVALYDNLLVFENQPADTGSGLHSATSRALIKDAEAIGAQTQFPLTVLVFPGHTMQFRFIYDDRRLSGDRIAQLQARLAAHLEQLVINLTTQPDRRLEQCLDESKASTQATFIPPEPRPQAKIVAPRTELERRLASLWQAELGIESISVHDNFFELGGHSLVALRMTSKIQSSLGRTVPLTALVEHPTIESLAARLENPAIEMKSDGPVAMKAEGPKQPLYCLPGAGGNILYLHELARLMDPERPFYALPSPGLDGCSEPLKTVESLASFHIRSLRRVQSNGPYLLAGHSFGGSIAFEMAQQLMAAGETVNGLMILDSSLPIKRDQSALANWDDARWYAALANDFALMADQESTLNYRDLQEVDSGQQFAAFQSELERLGFLPPNAKDQHAQGWVEVYRSNLLSNYVPANKTKVPITVFRAEEAIDRDHRWEGTDNDFRDEPTLGWDRLAQGNFRAIAVPGDHLTMMTLPHVSVLARQINACLDDLSPIQKA